MQGSQSGSPAAVAGADSDLREERELPARFGRRTLLKRIARGGMGEVFLAATGGIEGAERPCVVKLIRREHAEDRSFIARFLDEARIQAQLSHPGVAQVLEADTADDGQPYVVVELVEGRNLGEVRQRATQLGAATHWAEATAVGVLLADALAHVHERTDVTGRPLEIAHRDLSPQNVMVSYAGEVKLIDFGTARGENRRCRTVSGIVFAKPGYVAPEVANNTPGGAPADLYAFGIMLWELVAGRRFLTGDPRSHLAAVGAGERAPTPLAASRGVPPAFDHLIAHLTAYHVAERCESAREAGSLLRSLLREAPSLVDGQRDARPRIAQLMGRLYPAEPARSRAEFARLVAAARLLPPALGSIPPSPAPPPAHADVLAGTRYRLIRELGRGAMGVVHEAHHVDLERPVAIKVLPSERSRSEAAREELRAEARAVATLSHDNLVKLHDFGFSSDGSPFYVMELLNGQSLAQRLAHEGPLPWAEAVRIALRVAQALEVAHRAGIVHRDVKPAHVFLTTDGKVKLLDFGVAGATLGADGGEGEALRLHGTPEYMAPEQASSPSVDERADIYALGAVLYEAVTGYQPHVAESTVALLAAKQRAPEAARARAPGRGIPPALDCWLARALDPDPAGRPTSAADAAADLGQILLGPERERRRRRQVGAATLGLWAAVLAVGVWVGVRGSGSAGSAGSRPSAAADAPLGAGLAEAEPPAGALSDNPDGAADSEGTLAVTDEMLEDEGPRDAAPEGDGSEQPVGHLEAAPVDRVELDEPVMAASDAAPSDAGAPSAPVGDPKLLGGLAEVRELVLAGKRHAAYQRARRLGRAFPQSPEALEAWMQAAVGLEMWGEAHRVATQRAEIDASPEAQVELARMEKLAGKRRESVRRLRAVLEAHPGHQGAGELLESMGVTVEIASR